MATHLPVLIGLALLFPVRRVLELGAGRYSTAAFLDRRFFPDLHELHSFENDRTWLDAASKHYAGDSRCNLIYVSGAMHHIAGSLELGHYDLIFIDDSKTISDRARTVGEITHRCPIGPLMVIHDFEQPAYQASVDTDLSVKNIDSLLPATGVLWRGDPGRKASLEALGAAIGDFSPTLAPSRVNRWQAVLARRLPHY